MMKLLPVLGFYNIKLEEYSMLKDNITYPVLLVNKKYVLKRVVSEIVMNEILFNYLIEKKMINSIIKNRYERVFTYYDSCFWILTEYKEGREFDYSSNLDLEICAEYLKELHRSTPNCKDIVFHDNFSVAKWYADSKYFINHTFDLIKHYYGEIPECYKYKLLHYFNQLSFSMDDYNSMEKTLSHGEFQNTNVLFDKGIKIIDWDSLSLRPRLFDIVTSTCYMCRSKRGSFNIDMQRMDSFFKMFKLTLTEKRNINIMIFLCFVPKEDSIEKFYVKGKNSLQWYLEWTLNAMESVFSTFMPCENTTVIN